MKKVCNYLALIGLIGWVTACVEPLSPDIRLEPTDGSVLDISIRCVAPSTKADPDPYTLPGEDKYNENLISYIDWFIFATNNGNETPKKSGRKTLNQVSGSDYFEAVRINMDDYHATNNLTTGIVYVIANLKGYTHDDLSGKTLTQLKELETAVSFKFVDGSFVKQDDFVMTSAVTGFTLAENTLSVVQLDLTRLAVKITLDMDVAYAIDVVEASMKGIDTTRVKYLQTWYPNVDKIQMYLTYVRGKTPLTGEPQEYEISDNSGCFTYNRSWWTSDTPQGGTASGNPPVYSPWKITGSPFYTYPVEWDASSTYAPFIKIIVPWTAYQEFDPDGDDADDYYVDEHYIVHGDNVPVNPDDPYDPIYEEVIKDEQGNPIIGDDGQPVKRKYRIGQKLGNNVPRTKDEDKIILQPNGKSDKEFFYKILIPADNLQLNQNNWYKIKVDVGVLGSMSDDLSTLLAGQYYVVDWSDRSEHGGGVLVQPRYLDIANDTYIIYGGDDITIPVLSSHKIKAAVTGVTFKDYSQKTEASMAKSRLQDLPRYNTGGPTYPYRPAMTIADDGHSYATFTHTLISDPYASGVSSSNKPDIAEYTFTIWIYHDDLYTATPTVEGPYAKKITIIQRPPLMIENKWNSGGRNDYGYVLVNGSNATRANGGPYGGVRHIFLDGTGNDNANPNMYVISTTVVPTGVVIADPRGAESNLGSNYSNWTANGIRLYGSGNKLAHYYPADKNSVDKIAPVFRVASSYGVVQPSNNSYLDLDNAKKRCATYQEDGFPAGRWRIPTKAEIEFMITLSNLNVIPSLFTATGYTYYNYYYPNYYQGGYWTADGGVIYPWTNEDVGYLNADDFYTHSHYPTNNREYAMPTNGVRCVYDEWYWGSDQLQNKNQFTWGDKQIQ